MLARRQRERGLVIGAMLLSGLACVLVLGHVAIQEGTKMRGARISLVGQWGYLDDGQYLRQPFADHPEILPLTKEQAVRNGLYSGTSRKFA